MLRNVISIYLFSGVIITSFFTTYLLSKSRLNSMKVFSTMSFCVNLYIFGYLLEINSSLLEQMIFWNQVQYFGIPFFPGLWLMVALLYNKKFNNLGIWPMILLFTVPVLTFFLRLTNSFHYLYYSGYEMRNSYGFSLMYLVKGPWYYVNFLYLLTTMIIATVVLFRKYRISIDLDRKRYLILIIASLIPFIGFLLSILNYRNSGIDFIALILPFSLILIMFAIFNFNLLEIKTLAREKMFENNTDGMILLNNNNIIMDYNKAAKKIFHITDSKYQNYVLEDILCNRNELIELFKSDDVGEFTLNQDGQEKFYEISSSIIRLHRGKMVGFLKTIRDVTDKKKLELKLKILATTDELSGLSNRRKFMIDAEIEFERAKRYKLLFSVLMIDIDNFKQINDTYGHAAGDEVIKEFGNLISNNFRKTDIYGRIGGEEFSIILQNTDIYKALLVADNFRKLVAKSEVKYNNIIISLTVSIGISSYTTRAKNISEIIKYADEALYESKEKGKNCITIKNPINNN